LDGRKVNAKVVWPLNQDALVEFEFDDVVRWIQLRIDEP